MIIGLGIDIVDVSRIKRLLDGQGTRFKNRLFTKGEQSKADGQSNPENAYAKRFAAKEAFVKAIQTNMDGISWLDMEIINLPSGAPELNISGKALEALTTLNPNAKIFLSLSDTDTLAQATVIIEGTP